MADNYAKDVETIESIVSSMFSAISWTPEDVPDWDRFREASLDGALLAPSARPLAFKTMDDFIAGMDEQRRSGALKSFDERVLRQDVTVFGNIALSRCSYAAKVNGGDENRGVNMFLFAKSADRWRIVAMAWDSETEGHPIPADLV